MPINALAEAKPRSSVIEQRSPKPRASSILAAGIPFTTHDVRELARKSAVFREKTASDRVALSTAELDLLAGSAQGHRVSIGSRHTSCPAGAWAPHMARVSQTCAGDDFFHCPLFGPDTRRRSADLRLRRRELIAPAGRRCQREAEARRIDTGGSSATSPARDLAHDQRRALYVVVRRSGSRSSACPPLATREEAQKERGRATVMRRTAQLRRHIAVKCHASD
jgi:hypothetical protein